MEIEAHTWKVRSASVCGTSHLVRALECQDSHSVSVLPDQTLIVVVCDGAGSAAKAAAGSTLAAHEAQAYLTEKLTRGRPHDAESWRHLLTETIVHARGALATLASHESTLAQLVEVDDFATTLLIAGVAEEWLAVAQVGDGAIVSKHASGALAVLTLRGDSEYINETTFLTSPSFLDRAHFHIERTSDVVGLVAMSDGLQLLALKVADNTAHAPFFDHMLDFVSQPDSSDANLEAFLRSDRVCERTDDDKTLVLALRA